MDTVSLTPRAAGILQKLVHEHSYASSETAVELALERLLDDEETDESDDLVALLREAEEDYENGDRGLPLDEAFEQIRRDLGLPPKP